MAQAKENLESIEKRVKDQEHFETSVRPVVSRLGGLIVSICVISFIAFQCSEKTVTPKPERIEFYYPSAGIVARDAEESTQEVKRSQQEVYDQAPIGENTTGTDLRLSR